MKITVCSYAVKKKKKCMLRWFYRRGSVLVVVIKGMYTKQKKKTFI